MVDPAMSHDSQHGLCIADVALPRLARHLSLTAFWFLKVDQ